MVIATKIAKLFRSVKIGRDFLKQNSNNLKMRYDMKTFKRIQAGVAAVALWTAIAVSNSYEATGKEIFASVVLVVLAGMVVVSVLIERAKEETK